MADNLSVSVVIPMFDEADSVRPLYEGVRRTLGEGADWELVLVDDGSTDATAAVALDAEAADPRVRLVRLGGRFGQTAALQAGFDVARGNVVVTMDGDLQSDAADIPRLVDKLREGYDLVVGYREHRKDELFTRRIPSWCANRLITLITNVRVRDHGCPLKAFRRNVIERLNLYSDMHRFIPVLAVAEAGARVAEIPVRYHDRRFGRSKYNLARAPAVLIDLLILMKLRGFRDQPLLMFSRAALIAFAVGFAAAVFGVFGFLRQPVESANLVMPGVVLVCVGLAAYLFMLGLLGEVAVREHRHRRRHPPLTRSIA